MRREPVPAAAHRAAHKAKACDHQRPCRGFWHGVKACHAVADRCLIVVGDKIEPDRPQRPGDLARFASCHPGRQRSGGRQAEAVVGALISGKTVEADRIVDLIGLDLGAIRRDYIVAVFELERCKAGEGFGKANAEAHALRADAARGIEVRQIERGLTCGTAGEGEYLCRLRFAGKGRKREGGCHGEEMGKLHIVCFPVLAISTDGDE